MRISYTTFRKRARGKYRCHYALFYTLLGTSAYASAEHAKLQPSVWLAVPLLALLVTLLCRALLPGLPPEVFCPGDVLEYCSRRFGFGEVENRIDTRPTDVNVAASSTIVYPDLEWNGGDMLPAQCTSAEIISTAHRTGQGGVMDIPLPNHGTGTTCEAGASTDTGNRGDQGGCSETTPKTTRTRHRRARLAIVMLSATTCVQRRSTFEQFRLDRRSYDSSPSQTEGWSLACSALAYAEVPSNV
ncbi:hypothetical protein GQ600_9333 [Phytophthora cactorum]|nr:hypothetical protein GQ600_9333 [Phytophthora cactorum]